MGTTRSRGIHATHVNNAAEVKSNAAIRLAESYTRYTPITNVHYLEYDDAMSPHVWLKRTEETLEDSGEDANEIRNGTEINILKETVFDKVFRRVLPALPPIPQIDGIDSDHRYDDINYDILNDVLAQATFSLENSEEILIAQTDAMNSDGGFDISNDDLVQASFSQENISQSHDTVDTHLILEPMILYTNFKQAVTPVAHEASSCSQLPQSGAMNSDDSDDIFNDDVAECPNPHGNHFQYPDKHLFQEQMVPVVNNDRQQTPTQIANGASSGSQKQISHESTHSLDSEEKVVMPTRRLKGHEKMIEVFKQTIVDQLTVREILPYLPFIENQEDLLAVERRSRREAVMCLLNTLKSSKEIEKWNLFLEALQQCGYESIVQNIKGYVFIAHTLQQIHIKKLAGKLHKMIETRPLLPRLHAEGLISQNDREEIEREDANCGNIAASTMLLSRIHRKHPTWYTTFITVLRDEGYSEIAEDLDIPHLTTSSKIKVQKSLLMSENQTQHELVVRTPATRKDDYVNMNNHTDTKYCANETHVRHSDAGALDECNDYDNDQTVLCSDCSNNDECEERPLKDSGNSTYGDEFDGYETYDTEATADLCRSKHSAPSGEDISQPNDKFVSLNKELTALQNEQDDLVVEIKLLQKKDDLQKTVNKNLRQKREILRNIDVNEKEAAALKSPINSDDLNDHYCPESARIFWKNQGSLFSAVPKTTIHFENNFAMDSEELQGDPVKLYDLKNRNGSTKWSYTDSAIDCVY